MNKKTRSIKSEKWLHARTSVEIVWTNEPKADLNWLWRQMVESKNRDDDVKKTNRRPIIVPAIAVRLLIKTQKIGNLKNADLGPDLANNEKTKF